MDKIPKILHYVWLSNDPKPESIASCLESWSRLMPDYEIMCWDTNRFDVNSVPFVKAACDARKWAYATDYIRLYALLHHGGIYMDSDVMVHKRFDPFLQHSAFSSVEYWPETFVESQKTGGTAGLGIEAAVLGAVPDHPWIKACLDIYRDLQFDSSSDSMNSLIMSGLMAQVSARQFGFQYYPVYQVLKDDVHIYPPDVFSKRGEDTIIKYATHLCANSWRNDVVPKPTGIKNFLKYKVLGENNWRRIRSAFGRRD